VIHFRAFRKGATVLAILVLAAMVSSCGKKGPPEAPNETVSERLDDR
jgi:predicted small lipoprotein YifL